MIAVENLTVSHEERVVLRDLSLRIAPGEKAVLVGGSGAGKTTLLRALIGQVRPNAGRVRIAGVELGPDTIAEVRRAICYVPQAVPFFAEDAVRDFLRQPFRYRANRERPMDRARRDRLVARFRLPRDILDARIGDVSGGERQRLALIRALLLDRRVLLLDEVTSALDDDSKEVVMDAVLGSEATTVLAVSHDAAWRARSNPRVTLADGAIARVERD